MDVFGATFPVPRALEGRAHPRGRRPLSPLSALRGWYGGDGRRVATFSASCTHNADGADGEDYWERSQSGCIGQSFARFASAARASAASYNFVILWRYDLVPLAPFLWGPGCGYEALHHFRLVSAWSDRAFTFPWRAMPAAVRIYAHTPCWMRWDDSGFTCNALMTAALADEAMIRHRIRDEFDAGSQFANSRLPLFQFDDSLKFLPSCHPMINTRLCSMRVKIMPRAHVIPFTDCAVQPHQHVQPGEFATLPWEVMASAHATFNASEWDKALADHRSGDSCMTRRDTHARRNIARKEDARRGRASGDPTAQQREHRRAARLGRRR